MDFSWIFDHFFHDFSMFFQALFRCSFSMLFYRFSDCVFDLREHEFSEKSLVFIVKMQIRFFVNDQMLHNFFIRF